uniref:Protein kinase, cAMP-dependent, catalytic chain n=1 Tax=Neospora caninum (strain Liverpool) TaxID=572307 RepID=A0A0F7UKS5_NEOCL|nr:TPA: protein kinase, cAMP-dependent, catalytic chain [Neospora caninum Liverpool]
MQKPLLPPGTGKEAFEFGPTLGTGSFGRVKSAKYLKSMSTNVDDPTQVPPRVAVKLLKKAAIIKLKHVDHIINEKKILLALDHPLTVLFGILVGERHIQSLCMCLSYARCDVSAASKTVDISTWSWSLCQVRNSGEFFTHLRKAKRFDNDTARFYAAQIPENMLLDKDGYIKLTDFGFAKIVEFRTDTLCGTPEYIAPEVLLNKGHGKPVDWWTLGILIYEMMVGYPPFLDDDPLGIYQKILAGKFVFPKFFDKDAKVLVKKLLQADLSKRWGNLKNGVRDIKECKWFCTVVFEDLRAKKVVARYKPTIKGMDDLSNFEAYPDEKDDAVPVDPMKDPFTTW